MKTRVRIRHFNSCALVFLLHADGTVRASFLLVKETTSTGGAS